MAVITSDGFERRAISSVVSEIALTIEELVADNIRNIPIRILRIRRVHQVVQENLTTMGEFKVYGRLNIILHVLLG